MNMYVAEQDIKLTFDIARLTFMSCKNFLSTVYSVGSEELALDVVVSATAVVTILKFIFFRVYISSY